MTMLAALLDSDAISLNVAFRSKKRLLEHVANLLGRGDSELTELIFERLLERERLGSTGMTNGVALPHARIATLQESRAAFIRLTEAIEFDSQDGQPVDLVFTLIVPEQATQQHVELLAEISRLLRKPEARQRMRSAVSPKEIYSLVSMPQKLTS